MTTETFTAPAHTRAIHGVLPHYIVRCLQISLRDWSFLAFVIAMPTAIYLFFAGIYGDQPSSSGVSVSALMMVMMAAYGGLGAAMSAGAQIQAERSSGWFRQLMLTGLTPVQFIVAKIVTAVGVTAPAIAAVFGVAAIRGVRMEAGQWLASFALLLASLTPMAMLGLTLGMWLKQQAAQAATTLVMLALSMLGGLWFPLDMMPPALQTVGKLLPSYSAGQIGTWPLLQGTFPWQGVWVIAGWTAALVVLGALGYRRAIRSSRR